MQILWGIYMWDLSLKDCNCGGFDNFRVAASYIIGMCIIDVAGGSLKPHSLHCTVYGSVPDTHQPETMDKAIIAYAA